MKNKFIKEFRQAWLTAFLLMAITCSAMAQYTLTDDDVTVENGVITACNYGFAEKNIIIPETLDGQTVTGIADGYSSYHGIFYNKGITDVSLPATLESVGDYAFYKNFLTNLDLSGCMALTGIGDEAFANNSLASLDLSKCTELTSIGGKAFYNNSFSSFSLPTPANNEYAKYGWKDGNSNTYSNGDAVSDLRTNYYVPAPYTLTDDDVTVENGIITSCSYCFTLKSIIIPETLHGQTVTGIVDASYYTKGVFYNKGIASVGLPATLESIGDYVFYNNSISSLDLSGCTVLKRIGEGVFLYNFLTTVDLSKCSALAYIGESAFYRNSLSSLTLPTPDYANFKYWYDANDNHYSGNSVVNDLKTPYAAFILYTLTEEDVTVKDGVIIACSYSFALTDIIIPETLDNQTIIGIADGDDYDNGVFCNKGITYVNLPATLINVGNYAFYENSLIKLDLSSCVALTTIGREAFSTNFLHSLDISDCAALTIIGEYAFGYNDLTGIDISGCTALTSIGENAFYGNELTGLDLSGCAALTTIGEYAFRGNSIITLDLSGCIALTSIEGNAFSDNSLASIDLTGCEALTTIGSYAFYDNSIVSLDLSDCVALTTIGFKSFAFNSIASLDLSGCVALTSIRENAFYNNSLTDLDLSKCKALVSIGYGAFASNSLAGLDLSGCTALTTIGDYAFSENSIAAMDLSKCTMLTTIGEYAFNNNSLSSFALPVNIKYASYGWKDGVGNAYTGGDEVSTFSTYYYVPAPYTVTFTDWDGTVLKTETAEYGNAATAPTDPVRDGFVFTGWDVDFSNIISDLVVTAQYEIVSRIKETTGIRIMVYPNPAKETVIVQLPENATESVITIFDLNGNKLIEKQIPPGTELRELKVSDLKSGVYLCKLSMENKSVTKKLIIQR